MENNSIYVNDSEAEASRPGWVAKLPTLMRTFGAAAVLFSLYSFLFKGWEGSSDLMRYLMLLGHTGMLAAIALISGRMFKEGKGPRLLIILGLVSVTVNFSILGAFLLSSSGNAMVNGYPQYVRWTMDSFPQALLLTGAALLVLLPVISIGFKVLARGMSQRMSILYMLGNVALLMPLRDPLWVTLLAFSMGIYTLFISAKTLRQRTEVRTREGMIALLLQFLPVAVLLGRNIWLYSTDALLLGTLSLVVFIALRQCAKLIKEDSRLHLPFEWVSALLAVITGGHFYYALVTASCDLSLAMMLSSMVISGLIYELSYRAHSSREFYRVCAASMLAGGGLITIIFSSTIIASLLSLMIGLAMVVVSYFLQQRSLLIAGVLLLAGGMVDQLLFAMTWFDVGYWVGLAVIGVVAIVLASVLESRGDAMTHAFKKYRDGYRGWSY